MITEAHVTINNDVFQVLATESTVLHNQQHLVTCCTLEQTYVHACFINN